VYTARATKIAITPTTSCSRARWTLTITHLLLTDAGAIEAAKRLKGNRDFPRCA
jgi:hypothetical protein